KERKEKELPALFENASFEGISGTYGAYMGYDGTVQEREDPCKEAERERRLEVIDAGVGKISEKVSLGMTSACASREGEVMYI
nr:hypothetical protein [Tanacetum cinerariifolium]